MKTKLLAILLVLNVPALAQQDRPQRPRVREKPTVRYEHGPDSKRKEGVPQGQVSHFTWTNSTVFPGTIRHYSIYVPAQYDANTPAALMVFQDGHTY